MNESRNSAPDEIVHGHLVMLPLGVERKNGSNAHGTAWTMGGGGGLSIALLGGRRNGSFKWQ